MLVRTLGGRGKTGSRLLQRIVPLSGAWGRARVRDVVQGVPGKSLEILQAFGVGGRVAAAAHVEHCQYDWQNPNQLTHRQSGKNCLLSAETE